jgi:excisionase family DNA binding protein
MATTDTGESFWSTTDVAKYLGVPESTIRYWAYQGTGPKSFKIGRRRKFKPSDVRKWAEAQADEPAEPVQRRTTTKPTKRTTTMRTGRARAKK